MVQGKKVREIFKARIQSWAGSMACVASASVAHSRSHHTIFVNSGRYSEEY
jgi:hypothetical protein